MSASGRFMQQTDIAEQVKTHGGKHSDQRVIDELLTGNVEQLKSFIADFLKENPNAKVQVTGYADVQTGNAKINARLAQERADIVVKTLIDDYGISADRITYSSYGDTVQPFAENDLNRVSICIAEVK